MGFEQKNPFGQSDSDQPIGNNRAEIQALFEEQLLKKDILEFINIKENKEEINAMLKEDGGELGGINVDKLTRQFASNATEEGILQIRPMIAEVLKEKGYVLRGSVDRGEIRKADGVWMPKQLESEEKAKLAAQSDQKIKPKPDGKKKKVVTEEKAGIQFKTADWNDLDIHAKRKIARQSLPKRLMGISNQELDEFIKDQE